MACEFSGIVRDAFIKKGHDAWSCDILPTEREGPHIQDDVRKYLHEDWDIMIAFPPCTHLCVSGARWFKGKQAEQDEALNFVRTLFNAPIKKIAIENPVGIISTRIRKPTQIIQPWMFGEPHQKTTCLWLNWLPPLIPTQIVDKGEFYTSPKGKRLPRWYTNYGGGMGKERSVTFQGIANAMADQWG